MGGILRNVGIALVFAGALGFGGGAFAQEPTVKVSMQTSMGEIVLELDREHAPATVENFLRYAKEGHFDGTIFYRIEPGFVIQAGSQGADGGGRAVHEPIPLEANNGLKNVRGAISMARDAEPRSAQAEFFIVLADNPGLDPTPDDMENKTGYAVFGHVIMGMDVVDAIAGVPLGGPGPFPGRAPLTPILINNVAPVN
jgi:cyclophilin family peptidyl-prolyl cis-trans isomerase